jgi:hypothetical protein
VDRVNQCVSDPLIAEQIRDNFVSYTSVLKDGRFRTDDYLNAVMYVSFKLMGQTNHEAYMRTFPQRYADLLAKGTSSKDIAAYVVAYNKGKLVNLILEQSLVPVWVLNQDIYQRAINTQVDLMENSESDKVRCEAANSLLTHLKKPEALKAQLSVEVNDNSGMSELKDALQRMAQKQQELIQQGLTTREIAASPMVIDSTATVILP